MFKICAYGEKFQPLDPDLFAVPNFMIMSFEYQKLVLNNHLNYSVFVGNSKSLFSKIWKTGFNKTLVHTEIYYV